MRRFNQIYFKSIPRSGKARGTPPHTSKGENDLAFSSAPFLFAIGSQQARPDKEASPLVRCFPYRRRFAVWQQNKTKKETKSESISFWKQCSPSVKNKATAAEVYPLPSLRASLVTGSGCVVRSFSAGRDQISEGDSPTLDHHACRGGKRRRGEGPHFDPNPKSDSPIHATFSLNASISLEAEENKDESPSLSAVDTSHLSSDLTDN